jgi:hypothetical protein
LIFLNSPISKAVPKASKSYEFYYPSYSGRVEFLKKYRLPSIATSKPSIVLFF